MGDTTAADVLGDVLDEGRHISGMTTTVIVRWVRGQAGDEGVDAMFAYAGDDRPVSEVEDPQSWSSYRQATALLEAAVAVTGRTDAARRIGEEMLAQHRGTPLLDLLQSLGTPEALLESIAASGSKFSTVLFLEPLDVAPGRATVAGTTAAGIPRHRLLCDFTSGILSVIPSVFGMDPATVSESECQARGGTRCVYHVGWNPASSADVGDPQRRVRYLEEELAGTRARLASLQATASEIVHASDVDTALEAVVRRAGEAVGAAGHLLAVRLHPNEPARIFGTGVPGTDRLALGRELLGGPVAAAAEGVTGDRIVVDVRSGERIYGQLAAFYPMGTAFFPQERELLIAYAGHAAAVLDTANALEEARAQNRTAQALLELSAALSRSGSRDEVSRRLVAAVPQLVDCDGASVLLWDDVTDRIYLTATNGPAWPGRDSLMRFGISAQETPVLAHMLADPSPVFFTADTPDPFLSNLLQASGSAAVAVLPIVGHDRFYGVVTAEVFTDPERLQPDNHLLERIAGIAFHGATALENAKLLDELRTQATHDALTGQPNRMLLMDRLSQALASGARTGSSVALMFIDLDRFKEVNDVFGHVAGDELLVQVARRLAVTVRQEDTVARLGGDEFAVLLPRVTDDAEAVACGQRILAALEPPFALEGTALQVSASVGITVAHGDDVVSLDLLRQADGAMYAAKARGGGRLEIADRLPGPPARPFVSA